MHSSITLDRVLTAAQADDYIGICTYCGAEQGGVEPDATDYRCQGCGHHAVVGAETLVLRLA